MVYKPFPVILSILVLAFISVVLIVELSFTPSINYPILSGVTGGTKCAGSPTVIFMPNVVVRGESVTAEFSGMANCENKIVFLRQYAFDKLRLQCSCELIDGNQCSCSFAAPGTLCFFKDFYVQIDMNDDGDFNDFGESTIAQLYTSERCPND